MMKTTNMLVAFILSMLSAIIVCGIKLYDFIIIAQGGIACHYEPNSWILVPEMFILIFSIMFLIYLFAWVIKEWFE